jgi:hypothetical protein
MFHIGKILKTKHLKFSVISGKILPQICKAAYIFTGPFESCGRRNRPVGNTGQFPAESWAELAKNSADEKKYAPRKKIIFAMIEGTVL